MIACDNCGEWYHESCLYSMIPSDAWTDCSTVTSGNVISVSYYFICFYTFIILYFALQTYKLTEIVVSMFIAW